MMHRLHPRYTLRTLLVLVTLAAALFGWEEYVTWKEERAVRALLRKRSQLVQQRTANLLRLRISPCRIPR